MKEREKKLLEAIISQYLKSGESVGSRTIEKKYNFGISSATIRNTMADLEDFGFITKTHTSSGRVPTVEGYKIYLSEFLADRLDNYRRELIDKYTYENIDTANVLKSVSTTLSKISQNIGFVIEHSVEKEVVTNLKLVYINERESLVTMIIDNKYVKTTKILFDTITPKEVINELNVYIDEILMLNVNDLKVNDMVVFLSKIGKISKDIQGNCEITNTNFYFDGIFEMMERNDIDIENAIKSTKYFISNKDNLVSIVNEHTKEIDRTDVIFSKDLNISEIEDTAIIHRTYMIKNKKITIGVIGVTRMDYEKIFSYIESIRDISEYIINKNNLRKMIR